MLFHTTRHYYWTVFIYWDELLNVLNAELKKAKRLHGSTNKSSWPRLNLLEERWPGWLRAATSTSAVEEWNIHTCWQRPTCRALLQEKQTWHWFPLRRQTWWDTRGCDGTPSPQDCGVRSKAPRHKQMCDGVAFAPNILLVLCIILDALFTAYG